MNNNEDTPPQRRMLEKENVFFIFANGNWLATSWRTWNENVKDGTKYKSASINSKLNNKITVVGYNSWGENNYFAQGEKD